MIILKPEYLFLLEIILFTSVVFMHLTKKIHPVIFLYGVQSFIIFFVLFFSSLKSATLLLIAAVLLTFLVKVVIAPYFFLKLINRYRLKFSVSTYLNMPITLITLALLIAFSYSGLFSSLITMAPNNGNTLPLAMGMMFISIFLIINRKGVLSQIFGVLSLENAIVSFSYLSGLEVNAGGQIGILFDLVIWILITVVFTSMIHLHFGSLDASMMQHLKEE